MIGLILRFLRPQGIAGVALSLVLGTLLAIQWAEARHWKKQSASFQQLNEKEHAAFGATVADYRQAAVTAQAADKANVARVTAEQTSINQRTANDFETRLAVARDRADRLRLQHQAAADPGARPSASVPSLSASPAGPAQAAPEDGLPQSDQLTATEQAIQLDELIKWVRQQHAVRVGGGSGERPEAAKAQSMVDPNAKP